MKTDRTRRVYRLLNTPPAQWQRRFDRMTSGERSEIEDAACGLIQQMSMLAGYAGERSGYGCGDQGHASASKKANRVLVGVRKALGYTYPKAAQLRF